MNFEPSRLQIRMQPTETSCGPTCLKTIYDFYGHHKPLKEIIDEVSSLDKGGTLAVQLGIHALKEGFDVTIYTLNLHVFDPTWFSPKKLPRIAFIEKLEAQMAAKAKTKLHFASKSYIKFLKEGGDLRMRDLNSRLFKKYLNKGIPLLTGLSSTYLYQNSRERVFENHQMPDDIRGFAEGHFVVLDKYDSFEKRVSILDPYPDNPYSKDLQYSIRMDRLLNAILLGVMTYDANFMVIRPKQKE